MSIERRLILVTVGVVLLSGCEHDFDQAMNIDSTWGEANRQTMAAQVIDPEPDYTWDEMETSAEHSSQAIDRYRRDAVKKPERIRSASDVRSGRSN